MRFRLRSRSRAWFRSVALLPESRPTHGALGWFVLAFVACSAPDAQDLFVALPSNGGTGGSSGSAGSEAVEVDASTGAGGREGQGGAIGISGGGGEGAGDGNAGPPLADAGSADAGDAAPDAGEEPPACVARQEVCDGLDNDCDGVSDQGPTCVAECDGFAIDGRGYMFCSAAVNRAEAVGRCALEGMHLVWIDSAEEQDALIQNIVAANAGAPAGNPEILTQIGASDAAVEGVWSWVGGGQIPNGYQFWQGGAVSDGGAAVGGAFASWDDLEPNDANDEDCALMSVLGGASRAAGAWDDRGCEAQFPFACEQQ